LRWQVRLVERVGFRGLAAHEYDAAISAMLASVKERGQTAVWALLTDAVQAWLGHWLKPGRAARCCACQARRLPWQGAA